MNHKAQTIRRNQVRRDRGVRFVKDVDYGAFMVLQDQNATITDSSIFQPRGVKVPSVAVELVFAGGLDLEPVQVHAPLDSIRVRF